MIKIKVLYTFHTIAGSKNLERYLSLVSISIALPRTSNFGGAFYLGDNLAKRFTDSTKWDNPWYRKLPWQYRCLWDYMLDKCDHAGIWRADLEIASLYIGEELLEKEAFEHFGDRVKFLKEDKWFIPSFVVFQYGNVLSSRAVCVSVRKILEIYNINPSSLIIEEPIPVGYQMIKDKRKDKDKDKRKDTDKEKDKEAIIADRKAFLDGLAYEKIKVIP